MPGRRRLALVGALTAGLLTTGLATGPAFAADDSEGPDDTDASSTEMATSNAISGAITDAADDAASDTEGKDAVSAKAWRVAAETVGLPDDDATATDASGATAAVTYKTLTITTQMQKRSYWCGPAAGRATLTAFGVTKDQGAMAASMHTTVAGTYASKIYPALNTYESRNHYYDDKTTKSAKDLFARTKVDVGSAFKAPLIPLVQGHSLPMWNNVGYHGLHFISLYGYGSDGVSIKYFDPIDATALYGRHVVNRKYVYAAMNARYDNDGKADNELVW
ncbi:C39 family peptidase [Streptomyces sp. NPDC001843]|uniref:C39 family peptidase n=1 Tax=Streptomyces sp. NPDC001843 TaxID=3364617 RepID=UPI0036A29C67